MFTIGLTGGICTGKSVVLSVFAELGCYTVKADDLAKAMLYSHVNDLTAELIGLFGAAVSDDLLRIDKTKLTQLIFHDDQARQLINTRVFPYVWAERDKLIKQAQDKKTHPFFVYEAALLVESGTYRDFDCLIVTYSSKKIQIQRLIERDGLTRSEAEKRINSQFPLREKLKVAHHTIDTAGTLEQTRQNTLEVFDLLSRELPAR
jgi:dephospho-CoA kinase